MPVRKDPVARSLASPWPQPIISSVRTRPTWTVLGKKLQKDSPAIRSVCRCAPAGYVGVPPVGYVVKQVLLSADKKTI